MQRTMQSPSDIPPELQKALPGAIGAFVAFLRPGTIMQRIVAFVGGSAASFYGAGHVSSMLGTDQGFAGFLLGLFGMAVAAKVFDRMDDLFALWSKPKK